MIQQKSSHKSFGITKLIGLTRYAMVLAVFAIFVGSTVLLLVGTIQMLRGIFEPFFASGHFVADELRIVLIESVDTILVSTVLYVIAVGLYQLFINRSLDLPKWLQTDDVTQLEQRLAGMVVIILSVIFLTSAISGTVTNDLLWKGIAISAVICSISLFLYQEKKRYT